MTNELREYLYALVFLLAKSEHSLRAYFAHGRIVADAYMAADVLVVTFEDGQVLKLQVLP